MLAKGTITVTRALEPAKPDNDGKEVFKNWASFSGCIYEINNTKIDHAKSLDKVLSMYDLIEYSDNYSKTSESLLKYYRDKSALTDHDAIKSFHVGNNNSVSFKFKQRMTGVTDADGTKDVEIMVPLKYLGNIWKTLEMPLINCEINLILAWSEKCLLSNENATTFANTDTKLYVTVVTLSTQDNAKLLEQLKPGFKRTIKWNKYRPKPATKAQN